MAQKVTIALLTHFALATILFANAGPPQLPKDHKVVEPLCTFEGIDKHPDYVFHLYYYGYFTERNVIEVQDAKAFKLEFKRKDRIPEVAYIALKAMERKEFDKRKKADPELKWLDDPKAEGVLIAKLPLPDTTAPISVKEAPASTWRITLKDGKLTAEKVEDKKRDEKRPTGLLPIWAIGIVGSLSMAWLGVWYARLGKMNR
jgi:hypothetical protein